MKQKLFIVITACLAILSLGLMTTNFVKASIAPSGDISDTWQEIGRSFTVKEVTPAKVVTTAINYLMFAIAVISVVMIIIGGIRYATSGGSADKVKTAKNTILYACIGLAVALLALAIVNLTKKTTETLNSGGVGGSNFGSTTATINQS